MKTDEELVQEYLRDHPVKRIPARKRKSTQVQFSGRAVKGIRKAYIEILKDHRFDDSPEGGLSQ
jgi:hypothetical protein